MFLYRFLRSSIFTFVLFFLGVAIRFYICIYIALLLCIESFFTKVKILHTHTHTHTHTHIYIYALSVHTRPLKTAWVCFFTLNFTPSQIIIAGIFWGAGTELFWTLFSFLLALFFFFLTSALTYWSQQRGLSNSKALINVGQNPSYWRIKSFNLWNIFLS